MTYATARSLALTLSLFLFTSTAFAQVAPDSVRRSAWQQFQSQHGSGWQVHWNDKTGTPRTVTSGGGNMRVYAGSPAQAAKAFLSENRQLFGMEPSLPGLKLLSERQLRKVTHVRFQQTHQGVPVYDVQYLVHLRGDGRVTMANGSYYPNLDVSTTPKLSEQAAQKIAIDDLGGRDARREVGSKLVIYPKGGQFYLAWKLKVPFKTFGEWIYFVDAHNGTILRKHNALTSVVGEGKMYPTHPGISSVDPDADLYRMDNSGYLRGTYANVVNDKNQRGDQNNHDYNYGTSNTHFDEVNLYYHIDTFRNNFIEGLEDGTNSLGFTQITAHAHTPIEDLNGDGNPDPNAYFNQSTGELYFNDDGISGDGAKNFAREARWSIMNIPTP